MYQFKLPDLGEGIAEAEVAAWLVKAGDVIAADQLIAEIMTDKAVMEIPSPRAGRVHRLCVKEGNTIPVGQVLIEIEDSEVFSAAPGASRPEDDTAEIEPESYASVAEVNAPMVPAPPAGEPSATPKALKEEKHPPHLPPRPHPHPAAVHIDRWKPVDAVPAVRELAKQLGVDIEQVHGTGPEGRVMRRDVEAFYERMKTGEPQISPAPLSKGGLRGDFASFNLHPPPYHLENPNRSRTNRTGPASRCVACAAESPSRWCGQKPSSRTILMSKRST
jgi:pyruvate/2-oxoglutarate dehydrogenase complex dihydrolipoamide acyltransferase (E2) component